MQTYFKNERKNMFLFRYLRRNLITAWKTHCNVNRNHNIRIYFLVSHNLKTIMDPLTRFTLDIGYWTTGQVALIPKLSKGACHGSCSVLVVFPIPLDVFSAVFWVWVISSSSVENTPFAYTCINMLIVILYVAYEYKKMLQLCHRIMNLTFKIVHRNHQLYCIISHQYHIYVQ